jgi:hypothetical protein
MSEFLSRRLDTSIDDNVRWAIARKIIVRILETCPQDYLEELMVENHKTFIQVLIDSNFEDFIIDPSEFFNLVREKTFVMIFYEVMFRRLSTKSIRE